MNITITKPETKHTKAIAKICATGWRQTVEGVLSENYQIENVHFWYNENKVYHDIKAGTYSHIALLHDEVVGVIGGGMTGENVGEIFVLYVDETLRYKGIGRLLLEALTKQQLESDATEQWVSVQEGNMRGIPFYEARGFVFQGKKTTVTETGEKQTSLRYNRQLAE
ncbi:GNAT family N-acetyltransferase [Oceanobacillus bengalensis]|uniref:GNAT family N-acetyltransferase n=2 Tax=Oceanobacillus bengalensis TaxID=1435466 RepID=A0A494Z418_9BACI|nr:GNAT family N-acetyltransferase [Oceanobacillus bengalensis]